MKVEKFPEPLKTLREAEAAYLLANGWVKMDDTRWKAPEQQYGAYMRIFPGDTIFQRDAVQVQKDVDTDFTAGV